MKQSSITDIPRNVRLGEKDNFGIEPFENGLTDFINATNTPITIALQGEWGSGKTSLMNSLKQNLSVEDSSKFHSIWLNTWEYALMKDAQSTLIEIISKLIDEVSSISNIGNERKKKLLKNVRKIGFSALKVASSMNSLTNSVMGEAEKIFTQDKISTIGEIRSELEQIIEDCVQKDNKNGFIFFIDDLDRIDPSVAVELLELLKNIFTIKNCVFILAIDYDVVVKGLEPKFGKLTEANEREFRSFFDKIIQVPFAMPVTSYKIDTFLKESLKATNYLNDDQVNNQELIEKFSEISNLTVGSNPRALKRLLNSLSLIRCINKAKGNSDENNLSDEIELLVNFALVSIQIAYPAVYRLLSIHSGFDKWNESTAIQLNLKPLEEVSVEKLKTSEEFDEEWERVLFRLCENDYYLRKKSLNISRLLNLLRKYISEKNEDIENTISAIISLSSVTNVEAFDQSPIEYHKGYFLKHLRDLLIPTLKKKLPEISDNITPKGKRIQTNAYIKFQQYNLDTWIRMHTHSISGGVRLIFSFDQKICAATHNTLEESLANLGLEEELKKLENNYNSYASEYKGLHQNKLLENVRKQKNKFVIDIFAFIEFPSTEEFYTSKNIDLLSNIIVTKHKFITRICKLNIKSSQKTNN